MYRCIIVVSILLLTLTACGKDEPTKVKNGALLSDAIATRPLVDQQHTTETAPISAATVTHATIADSTVTNKETLVVVEPIADNAEESCITTKTEIDEPTTAIVTIGLQNRFGEVLLPHRLHVKLYHCYVCHTTNPPAKISKTKKEFHALCRKCHAELKQGPTKCRSCHMR